MKSRTTERFWKAFEQLPHEAQELARSAYHLFQQDPRHPGLRFKQVHQRQPIYSVRVGLHYRAIGVLVDDVMIWFWIGSHAEYDRLLRQL